MGIPSCICGCWVCAEILLNRFLGFKISSNLCNLQHCFDLCLLAFLALCINQSCVCACWVCAVNYSLNFLRFKIPSALYNLCCTQQRHCWCYCGHLLNDYLSVFLALLLLRVIGWVCVESRNGTIYIKFFMVFSTLTNQSPLLLQWLLDASFSASRRLIDWVIFVLSVRVFLWVLGVCDCLMWVSAHQNRQLWLVH